MPAQTFFKISSTYFIEILKILFFLLLMYFLFCFVQVITCGFPPLEDRDKSLKMLAGQDFFGAGALTKEETVSPFFLGYEKDFLICIRMKGCSHFII